MEHGGTVREAVGDMGDGVVGFRKQARALGFCLVPLSENARFPVRVIINGGESNPVVVRREEWKRQALPFDGLRVEVQDSGGRVGDLWALLLEEEGDRSEGRLPVDSKGVLQAVGADSRILWSGRGPDYKTANEAKGGSPTLAAYLRPGRNKKAPGLEVLSGADQGIGARLAEVTWNLGGFKRVMCAVDLLEVAGGGAFEWSNASSLTQLDVEFCAAPDQQAYDNVTLGPLWQNRDDTEYRTAYALLGSSTDAEGDFMLNRIHLPPFARFRLYTTQLLFELNGDGAASVADVKTTLTAW